MAPDPVVQPHNVAGWFELPWKLGHYTDPKGQVADQWELYDLDVDPFEGSNLVSWDAQGQPVVRQAVAAAGY